MSLHISVTEKNIRLGCVGSRSRCPVARATRRAIGLSNHLSGAWDAVHVYDDKLIIHGHEIGLPREVADWIVRYDDGYAVEPIAFDVELPDELAKRLGVAA